MATPTFHMQLVTPDARLFDGHVTAVTLPGELGEMQVLAGHIPLLTRLTPGLLRIHHADGRVQDFTLAEGFARIAFEEVCVLAVVVQT